MRDYIGVSARSDHALREIVDVRPPVAELSTISRSPPQTPLKPTPGRMEPERHLQTSPQQFEQTRLSRHNRLGQIIKARLSEQSEKPIIQSISAVTLTPLLQDPSEKIRTNLTPSYENLRRPQHPQIGRRIIQQPSLESPLKLERLHRPPNIRIIRGCPSKTNRQDRTLVQGGLHPSSPSPPASLHCKSASTRQTPPTQTTTTSRLSQKSWSSSP